MAKVSRAPAWQRAQLLQTGAFVGVVVIACLYWANVVFIPLALAVFLTFLMGPLVLALQRRGLGRIPSVVLVVALAAAVLGGVGWVVTAQIANLFKELPHYAKNVYAKTATLRGMGLRALADGIDPVVREVTGVPRPTVQTGPPPAPGEAKPWPGALKPFPRRGPGARHLPRPRKGRPAWR